MNANTLLVQARGSSPWAFVLAFAAGCWSVFVGTIKVSAAVVGLGVGVTGVLGFIYLLIRPDATLAHIVYLFIQSDVIIPPPVDVPLVDASLIRTVESMTMAQAIAATRLMLVGMGLASGCLVEYCEKFLGNWWRTVVRRKPSPAVIEAKQREALAALAEAVAENAALRSAKEG